ncbi:MAG: biotin/lipoyl-binding protein [Candidatus Latescibacteria bacterium]|nr:biotin/lipoyl-binding protein [Candidatus Latescibacterota bacterium]
MATEVVMPKLGLTMESGTIAAWLVEEGQSVQKGQPLLEVATDKVTMEVEAQASGILCKILIAAGEEVAVSLPIGYIADEGEDISDLVAGAAPTTAPEAEVVPASPPTSAPVDVSVATAGPAPASPAPPAAVAGRPHRASPKARKMAAEKGLDLSQIQGSGPGGRIVSADIESLAAGAPAATPAAAPAAAPVASEAGQVVPLTRPQAVAAERLTASSRDVPHIHLTMHVAAVWLQQFRQGYQIEGKKISFNDLIVKAVGRALGEFPRLNSVYEEGQVRQLAQVDIGIAADTPHGLMVPVIKNVPELAIETIAAESARLIDGARNGRLQPDDLLGGSFTISNLGMFGVSQFTAIINPPQAAILAVGAIEKRVVALDNDAMAVRPMLTLNLAADHRSVDGALGARFLKRLKEILETPGLLA